MLTRHSPLHAQGPCGSGVVSGESQFSGRLVRKVPIPSRDAGFPKKSPRADPLTFVDGTERMPRFGWSSGTVGCHTGLLLAGMFETPGNQARETSKPGRWRAPECVGTAADGV